MEKIWIQKELYFLSYEFLNLLDFSSFSYFYLIFNWFLKCTKGVYFRRTTGLMWHVELTWLAGPAQMRHSTQGHVAELRKPTWCSGGATWRRRMARATRAHADARVAPGGSEGSGRWRAHGLVGPCSSIRVVMHLRITAPPYIHVVSLYFLHVGLCFCGISPFQMMWQLGGRQMWLRCVNRVDTESTGSLIRHMRYWTFKWMW